MEFSNNLSSWNLVDSLILCAQSNTLNPIIDAAISDSKYSISKTVESEVQIVRSNLMLELAKVKQKITMLESKIKSLEDENLAIRLHVKEAQPFSYYAKKGDNKVKERFRSASFSSIVNNKVNNTTSHTSTSSSISTTNSLINTSSSNLSNVHPDRVKNIILPKDQKLSDEENKSIVDENKDNKENKANNDNKNTINNDIKANKASDDNNKHDKNTIAIYGLNCSSEDCNGVWIMKFLVDSGISVNNIDITNVQIYKPRKGKEIILVSFKNEKDLQNILSNKSKLKNTKWNNIFIKRWVYRIQKIFNNFRNGSQKFSRYGNNVNGNNHLNGQRINFRPAPPYLLPSPYIPPHRYQPQPYPPHQTSIIPSLHYQQQTYLQHQPLYLPHINLYNNILTSLIKHILE